MSSTDMNMLRMFITSCCCVFLTVVYGNVPGLVYMVQSGILTTGLEIIQNQNLPSGGRPRSNPPATAPPHMAVSSVVSVSKDLSD